MIPKMFQQKHLQVRIVVAAGTYEPTVDTIKSYSMQELMPLRTLLEETKSKLDVFYLQSKTDTKAASQWGQFQGIVDTYKELRDIVTADYNAQTVTNAWLKYYEIYHQYNIVPATKKTYLAFFNAELPGAALCAFNHFTKTMRPGVQADWRASSLAPPPSDDTTTVLGDSYGLYKHNKARWLMKIRTSTTDDIGNNGDATVPKNLEDLAVTIGPTSTLGGVDLYSHDAGIDVSSQNDGTLGFNQQEQANAKIHLGCALAGFMTLRVGGDFVAKQYTFFETFTWNLILLYAGLFDEFYICKPLCSRPYNSEIYLVGKGFRGISKGLVDVFFSRLGSDTFTLDPFIPADAVKQLYPLAVADVQRAARMIFNQQISFLNENVRLYDRYRDRLQALRGGLRQAKQERIREWIATYPLKTIADADQLRSNKTAT